MPVGASRSLARKLATPPGLSPNGIEFKVAMSLLRRSEHALAHPFDGTQVLVPADFAVIGRRKQGDLDAVCVADTNGCAAGRTQTAARISALCELVERDATGRWWYGRRRAPILKAETPLAEKTAEFLSRWQRQLWLLDITSDIGVPSVAALAMNDDGRYLAAGFATKPRRNDAIDSSLSEPMMMELKIAFALSELDSGSDLATWFNEIDLNSAPPIQNGAAMSCPDELVDFDSEQVLLDALAAAGCRVAFIEVTRPEFGIPVVRAISPDLCHWKPRFGRERLLSGSEIARPNDCILRI